MPKRGWDQLLRDVPGRTGGKKYTNDYVPEDSRNTCAKPDYLKKFIFVGYEIPIVLDSQTTTSALM